MTLITTGDLEAAKRDGADFGNFVNQDTIITPRSGVSYDSVRKIVRQSNTIITNTITEQTALIATAVDNLETEVSTTITEQTALIATAVDNLETEVSTTITEQTALIATAVDNLENITNQAINLYAWYSNRGAWQATTAYAVNDIFVSGGVYYLVVIAFTSTSNAATDIANGKVIVHQPKDGVQVVPSIALLRDFEPAYSNQTVFVMGHTITGMGGSMFRHNASDTETEDNDGTRVRTNVGDKLWERLVNDNSIYVEDFGAVGDGATDSTIAIQKTIDAVFALGGGAVKFKGGTYIASRLVIKRLTVLHSEAFGKVILKQKNASNQDFIITENFYALVNSGLRVKDSALVPYWCGAENVVIDGNKANQSSGNWRGLCIYAAAPISRGTLLVQSCKGDGFYTEYANNAGSDDWRGQEEGQFADVFVRDNDGKGWLFRGPHNSRLGYVVAKSNGDWGFMNETAENYDGLIDWVDCIHPYQNGFNTSRKGAYFAGSISIGKLIGDGGGTEVNLLENVGQRVRIGEYNGANIGVARPGVKVTSGQIIIDKFIGNPQNIATYPVLEILTGKNTINSFWSAGEATANLTAIKDSGSFNTITNIHIEGYTGANSVGLDLSASKSFGIYSGRIVNCKKAINYSGGTQNKLDFHISTSSGQEVITGPRPVSSDDFNIFATGALVKGTKIIAETTAGNRISLTTTNLQTITVAHTFLYTPTKANVTFLWSQISAVNDYEIGIEPTFVSADADNIIFKVKLRTSSATGGAVADIVLRVELP